MTATKGETTKWETVRCLRYGALRKLFHDRWGFVLPDDDAGRDDLWILVTNVSLAAAEPQKKMRHVIELWAPWMSAEEREAYVRHVWGLDIYERTSTGREIGQRLGLTNADRERLKLWPFKPIDATDEEIAERRKTRKRERLAQKRREKGIRTRADYLADLASKPKPWEAEGVSRSSWYRMRDKVCRQLRRGVSPTIVIKEGTHLVPPSLGQPPKECIHRGGELVKLRQTTEAREGEKHLRSSPHVETDPVPSCSPDVQDSRIASLSNWGVAAKQISPELRKRYLKLRERFDALTDPRLGAAA
ncbi:hypothetical protein [Methyloceanibacter sp.]|uniref:hypothetical protein n=1 Tax=Methyloceanibacter sp. TaxID=1965321 RepID=UPI003D9B3C5A